MLLVWVLIGHIVEFFYFIEYNIRSHILNPLFFYSCLPSLYLSTSQTSVHYHFSRFLTQLYCNLNTLYMMHTFYSLIDCTVYDRTSDNVVLIVN